MDYFILSLSIVSITVFFLFYARLGPLILHMCTYVYVGFRNESYKVYDHLITFD